MKKQRPLALLVEGNASTSALLRLRNFNSQVGPIKSTSLGAARRFANANRAGYAVETIEELRESRLILIRVPDEALPRVAEELANSAMDLKRICVVFCETWFGSDAMASLRERGAAVATISAAPSQTGLMFVGEGDSRALRLMKQVIERGGGTFLQIQQGTKALYFAAELLVTAMPVCYLAAAQKALREAGLSGRPLAALLDQLAARMLRNFKAATRIAEGGPLATCPSYLADQHLNDAASRVSGIEVLLARSRENASEAGDAADTESDGPPGLPHSSQACRSGIDGS